MLAQLPVDIVVGKMLIMGTLFHVREKDIIQEMFFCLFVCLFFVFFWFVCLLFSGDRASFDNGCCSKCPVSV